MLRVRVPSLAPIIINRISIRIRNPIVKTIKLDNETLNILHSQYDQIACGSTNIYPNQYSHVLHNLSENIRGITNNTLLGMIVTRPSLQEIVLGIVYDDHKEHAANEDFYIIHLNDRVIYKYKPSGFEKEYPQYYGSHKGNKDYLRIV